jgi:hypothetical protein
MTTITRVYEEWNIKKIKLLKEQGHIVKVLHEDVTKNKTHTTELPIGGLGGKGIILIEEGAKVRSRMMRKLRSVWHSQSH